MNKLLIIALHCLLLIAANPCLAQQTKITFANERAYVTFEGIDEWEFKPVQIGNRYGFDTGPATGPWGITAPDGKVEISPLFDKVCRFVNGYAAVKIDDQWGIINTAAEFVIEPAWEKVWSPDNNRETDVLVMRFSGDGVDSRDLYEVDPLEDWTNGFKPGIFPLWKDERWHLIDNSGTLIGSTTYERMLPMAFERAAVFTDNLWGYVGTDGRQVIAPRFLSAASFREGRAAVRHGNLHGYIDVSGEFVIQPLFERAGDFASGTAIVIASSSFGIIDSAGSFLLKPEYVYINEMPEPDLFNVCSAFETGLFHRTRGLILPVIYDSYEVSADGTIIARQDKLRGIFDLHGNALLPMTDASITSLGDSLLLITKGDSLSLFDARTKNLIQTNHRSICRFSDGLAAFQAPSGMWGFINRQLQTVIPADYTWVTDFVDGQAAVENKNGVTVISTDGRPAASPKVTRRPLFRGLDWQLTYFQKRIGVQDAQGTWRVRPEFQEIRAFSTGVILARRGETWLLLPAENNPAGNPVFEDVGYISENRCWVKSGGKCGYLDENGRLCIPYQYDQATAMRKGMAAVKKDRLWGFIDFTGKQLLPFVYTDISLQNDDSYIVFAGDKKGYVNTAGEFMPAESGDLPAEKP